MECDNEDINSSRSRRWCNYNKLEDNSEKKPIFFYALFLISVNILILYLFRDRPSTPSFEIDDFRVSSFELHDDESNHTRSDFSFYLSVKNNFKNKDGGIMLFSPMVMSLTLKHRQFDFEDINEHLSSVESLDPFLIDEKQQKVQFVMHDVTVDPISWNLNRGYHVLQFALQTRGHYVRAYKEYFDSCGIELDCQNIRVTFLPLDGLTYGIGINLPVRCKCKTDCRSNDYF